MDPSILRDAKQVTECLHAVAKVLKKHFSNLTVAQVIGISGEILSELSEVLEKGATDD